MKQFITSSATINRDENYLNSDPQLNLSTDSRNSWHCFSPPRVSSSKQNRESATYLAQRREQRDRKGWRRRRRGPGSSSVAEEGTWRNSPRPCPTVTHGSTSHHHRRLIGHYPPTGLSHTDNGRGSRQCVESARDIWQFSRNRTIANSYQHSQRCDWNAWNSVRYLYKVEESARGGDETNRTGTSAVRAARIYWSRLLWYELRDTLFSTWLRSNSWLISPRTCTPWY